MGSVAALAMDCGYLRFGAPFVHSVVLYRGACTRFDAAGP